MDFVTNIQARLQEVLGRQDVQVEVPKDRGLADFAYPCFRLAKEFKKAPPTIAQELAPQMQGIAGILKVEAVGGYLNFTVDTLIRARLVLEQIGQDYGRQDIGGGQTVCIDYSSINIAKPFHIGHLSTTAIGHSLYRIFNCLGYHSYGINYLGDYGTQFGKMIVAFQKWGDREAIEQKGIREMLKIYVKFHEEAKNDPRLEEQAREWFKKIEEGDPQALELFAWFKERTLQDVMHIYDDLGITFDSYQGESFYNDKMESVIDELREKKLLVQSEGAWVVPLEEYNMPPCLILKADGATLYATRDIASAIYRKQEYDFAQSLYVVAYQQDLHFRQVLKVLELMGKPWAKDCHHVSFGMTSMEEGTMSTRKGKVIFLEDILNQAVEKTLKTIQEKNPQLENKEQIAREVGIGAVVFSALSGNRINDTVFSYERVLSFEGESGPYLQYTHARCASLLEKGDLQEATVEVSRLSEPMENEIIRALGEFPATIVQAAQKYEPCFISRYLLALCGLFNKYYYETRILSEDEALSNARLYLVRAVKRTICNGLYLLGMKAPEHM